jgi:hypothetical protein
MIARPYARRNCPFFRSPSSCRRLAPRHNRGPVGHPLLERLSSPLICTGVGSAARVGGRTVAKTIAFQ